MGPAKEKKGPLQYFVKFLVLVILHSNFTYFLSASSNLIGLEFKTSRVFSKVQNYVKCPFSLGRAQIIIAMFVYLKLPYHLYTVEPL